MITRAMIGTNTKCNYLRETMVGVNRYSVCRSTLERNRQLPLSVLSYVSRET